MSRMTLPLAVQAYRRAATNNDKAGILLVCIGVANYLIAASTEPAVPPAEVTNSLRQVHEDLKHSDMTTRRYLGLAKGVADRLTDDPVPGLADKVTSEKSPEGFAMVLAEHFVEQGMSSTDHLGEMIGKYVSHRQPEPKAVPEAKAPAAKAAKRTSPPTAPAGDEEIVAGDELDDVAPGVIAQAALEQPVLTLMRPAELAIAWAGTGRTVELVEALVPSLATKADCERVIRAATRRLAALDKKVKQAA